MKRAITSKNIKRKRKEQILQQADGANVFTCHLICMSRSLRRLIKLPGDEQTDRRHQGPAINK